jgi:hypothetical protein
LNAKEKEKAYSKAIEECEVRERYGLIPEHKDGSGFKEKIKRGSERT